MHTQPGAGKLTERLATVFTFEVAQQLTDCVRIMVYHSLVQDPAEDPIQSA